MTPQFPSDFRYIQSIVANRLGCSDLKFCIESNQSIQMGMSVGNSFSTILMPSFLGGLDLKILLDRPDVELRLVPADDFVREILHESDIPVLIIGNKILPKKLVTFEQDAVHINFDLLGTLFYILTRIEEYKNPTRDEHDRFPASTSQALKNAYLHRPVVDELIEILWHCIKRLWPGLERKKNNFRTLLSHDVDVPFAETFSSPARIFRSFAGDLLKRKDVRRAVNRIRNTASVRRGDFRKDTNYTFDQIMDLSEKFGLNSAFYFKTECTNSKFDTAYPIEHPYLRQMLRDINNRGHEIGFHPSYETYKNSEKTRFEFEKLRSLCQEEGIEQECWGGRQHYLRWDVPTTWRNWAEAGLSYDSTLTYADCAGFRCGTCHEFPVFDLERRDQLTLFERPLIVMEGSLFSVEYMGLSHEDAFKQAKNLKDQCRRFSGDFTLLWHNSSFLSLRDWELFEAIISV